jgi:protein involved in plasmid replication-relaxation
VNWQAGSRLRIPEAGGEVLASLGEHRILSTAQVRAIHYPDRSPRRTQQALSYLERAGLVAHVEARRSPRRVWCLTEAGADLVTAAGDIRERPKVLSPKQAAGPLTAHTLGVNEVGISFLRAARERGDDFAPLSWRHEVAHPLNRGRGRARRSLIADAVFTYVRPEDWEVAIYQRFVEVDRATLSVERLVAELARYGQLYRAREKRGGEPIWRYYYRHFPSVICVLTGAPRKALDRRLDVAAGLLAEHPALDRAYDVAIYFCLLEDLKDRGPFAPIFCKLDGLDGCDRAVDWTGAGSEVVPNLEDGL